MPASFWKTTSNKMFEKVPSHNKIITTLEINEVKTKFKDLKEELESNKKGKEEIEKKMDVYIHKIVDLETSLTFRKIKIATMEIEMNQIKEDWKEFVILD